MDLKGRIFLVTGSTDGIGRHTATLLAQANATVLVHGRNKSRGEQVVKALKQTTGNDDVHLCLGDLSSFEAIRALSQDIHERFDRIDTMINNAGVFEKRRTLTENGLEMTFAVNVAAPYMLTGLLLDLIKRGNKPRITIVSSISQGSSIDLTDLNSSKSYSAHSAYSLSKLCDAMLAYEMAEVVKPLGIVVNTQDPGTVNTKMLFAGWGACGIEVDEADNEFWLATSPEAGKVTGQYFIGTRTSRSVSVAYDQKIRRGLWNYLSELTCVTYT